jgi:hypothetical protein
MSKTMLCAALITALLPAVAGSHADRDAADVLAAPLGLAIAVQGNEALRAIRHEARVCLASQKPAPLSTLIREVRREAPPAEVVQLHV